MSNSEIPNDPARRAVTAHTRGTICAAEVWHQFVDHATAETFPKFMAELTPELQAYFRQHILVYYPEHCQHEEEQRALQWLSDYYAHMG